MRILFFGTPNVAVPFLNDAAQRYEVVGAVTQPDKPAERGHQLKAPPVKTAAQQKNIPVFQPGTFTPEVVAQFAALKPDAGLVVAYGRIIPPDVFTLPKLGCFNVHFSLLPKYRGAAPVQWALINGETETGVTTFRIEKGLDTGPVLVRERTAVEPDDDTLTLMDKLVTLGLEAVHETVDMLSRGEGEGRPQEGETSYAPSLKKEDGKLDWTKPAPSIINRIRGTKPWPGVYTVIEGGRLSGSRLKILRAVPLPESFNQYRQEQVLPGEVTGCIKNAGFSVRCGGGFLLVEEVQPENRKPMDAWSFCNGGFLAEGYKLT